MLLSYIPLALQRDLKNYLANSPILQKGKWTLGNESFKAGESRLEGPDTVTQPFCLQVTKLKPGPRCSSSDALSSQHVLRPSPPPLLPALNVLSVQLSTQESSSAFLQFPAAPLSRLKPLQAVGGAQAFRGRLCLAADDVSMQGPETGCPLTKRMSKYRLPILWANCWSQRKKVQG